MAAIELTDRHHIESGDEQAYPPSHEIGIELILRDGGASLQRPRVQMLDQQLHDPRQAIPHPFGRYIGQIQTLNANPDNGHCNNQPSQRTSQPNIKNLLAIGPGSVP